MLCAGDNNLKARVFYDVLQDSLQETISANDKDFGETFEKLITLATKLAYQFEAEQRGVMQGTEASKITDELIETLKENFLDGVFGSNSKLPRKDYITTVATKQNWIFNSKQIRDQVNKS